MTALKLKVLLVLVSTVFITDCSIQDFDMSRDCKMSLGYPRSNGLKIKCAGGRAQNEQFLHELKRHFFLPSFMKIAMETEFCSVAQLLSRYHRRKGKRSGKALDNKTILEQLSDEQLQQFLDELTIEVKAQWIILPFSNK